MPSFCDRGLHIWILNSMKQHISVVPEMETAKKTKKAVYDRSEYS